MVEMSRLVIDNKIFDGYMPELGTCWGYIYNIEPYNNMRYSELETLYKDLTKDGINNLRTPKTKKQEKINRNLALQYRHLGIAYDNLNNCIGNFDDNFECRDRALRCYQEYLFIVSRFNDCDSASVLDAKLLLGRWHKKYGDLIDCLKYYEDLICTCVSRKFIKETFGKNK